MMRITPLAAKLCRKQNISPAALRGTGPGGRITAADVRTPAAPATPADTAVSAPTAAPARRSGCALGDFAVAPTRSSDGYAVYDTRVDMAALAAISLPIAVQCEKLLENRYSLFDYIVRAVVKACTSAPVWCGEGEPVRVILFENSGRQRKAIDDAASQSIYRLARTAPVEPSAAFAPHIIICDALTTREQVRAGMAADHRPAFAFVVRGGSPKVGIRAGKDSLPDFNLEYSFYASAAVPPAEANRIAARLRQYLYSPATLLLL